MKWRHDMKGLSVKTAVWCSGVLHQLHPYLHGDHLHHVSSAIALRDNFAPSAAKITWH